MNGMNMGKSAVLYTCFLEVRKPANKIDVAITLRTEFRIYSTLQYAYWRERICYVQRPLFSGLPAY